MTPTKFTVRVYPAGGPGIVVPGGIHPLFGTYVDAVSPSGKGYMATSGRRITIDGSRLQALPAGSDADFELTYPLPAEDFQSR